MAQDLGDWPGVAPANDPKSLSIENSDGLVVEGKIDLDDLVMVIAGAVAGGP